MSAAEHDPAPSTSTPNPRSSTALVVVNARVSPAESAALRAAAATEGLTLSQYLRRLIVADLAR